MKRIFSLAIIFYLLTIPFGQTTAAQDYQLKRVEPLNWWTNMENPELQLMLYGKDIGELNPKINYEGISIKKVRRTDNNNYLFIYLHIGSSTKPGTVNITLSKNGKTKLKYNYRLKERKKESAARQGFDASDAIYLITPDRFANGDPANDQLKEYADTLNRDDDYDRHGGDIQGIIDHLDYIKEMGFTAIWLNPVLENAMSESSYHGYSITDYYHVDPRFGSNELYQKLAKEAHKRGIKLIMDMVMNHTGSNYWWMEDLPAKNWLHYPKEHKKTNHRRSTLHDPYAASIDKKRFTNGWFVDSMPDLNQQNKLLGDYLIYNSLWWIEYAGLRGIRHDTHPYAGQKFMERWTCRIMSEYPNFNIVGEEWGTNPAILAKWQRGSELSDDFDSCLPSLMDFPIQTTLIDALTSKEKWNSGFIDLYKQLSYDYLYPNANNLVIFADNHDMDRFYRQVNQDYHLFRMGLTYIMTMRGIPQFYYGTELLMSNAKGGDHGQIREDFPGGWAADSANGFRGTNLPEKQQKAQHFVKKLVNWRKDHPVVYNGKLMQYAPKQNGTYVYFRYNAEQTVMVIFNKNEQTKTLNTKRYHERLDGFNEGTDVITNEEYDLGELEIPPRSALILELE